MKKLIEKILIKLGILANEQENKICNDIDLQLEKENKLNGFCDDCYIYNNCGWFCNIEKDEDNNPSEPCFSKEIERIN